MLGVVLYTVTLYIYCSLSPMHMHVGLFHYFQTVMLDAKIQHKKIKFFRRVSEQLKSVIHKVYSLNSQPK